MAIKGELDLEIGKFRAKLARASNEARRESQRMQQQTRGIGASLTDSFRGGRGGVGGAFTGGVGILTRAVPALAAGKLAMDSWNAALRRESLEAGLASNSTESLATQMDRLRELGKKPGLGFEQTIEASTRLQAVGLSAQQSEGLIEEMGNALALVGKGKADLDGVVLALTQIAAKGKITAQEINQIAERVPQIRGILEKAFGTSDTEALQKMNLSSEAFFEGITQAAADLPRATATMREEIGNLGDSWNDFLVQIGRTGEVLTPVISQLSEGLSAASELIGMIDDAEQQKEFDEALRQANLKRDAEKRTREALGPELLQPGDPRRLAPDDPRRIQAEKNAAAAASPAKEQTEEEKRDLEQIKRLREQIAAIDLRNASDEEKIGAMKQQLEELLSTTVGMFPAFEKSVGGLEELAETRAEKGSRTAKEAFEWLRNAKDLEADIAGLEEKSAEKKQSELEKLMAERKAQLAEEEKAAVKIGGRTGPGPGAVAGALNVIFGRDAGAINLDEARQQTDLQRRMTKTLEEIRERLPEFQDDLLFDDF